MNPVIRAIAKKVIKLIYEDVFYPCAKKYVQSTTNQWDDRMLKFLDDYVKHMLDKF